LSKATRIHDDASAGIAPLPNAAHHLRLAGTHEEVSRCATLAIEHLKSRPAKIGDQLVTTKFGRMCTIGFCAVGEPRLAVCIKPGTELAFEREIEREALLFKRRLGSRVARFRLVNEDRKYVHHDAL